MSLASGVYVGHVRHRRRDPSHAFSFPLFMVYLDLDELPVVLSMSRWWGVSRWCPARFVREDYLQRDGLQLSESIRACVAEQTGRQIRGPIRMLTHLRYFGHIFNPVTFYYCFDTDGVQLECIVAEITNTPWKERHAYVLPVDGAEPGTQSPGRSAVMRWRFGKRFHVSPFIPMDMQYDWAFRLPGQRLLVHMNLRPGGGGTCTRGAADFDATLVMARRELSPRLMRGLLARYPFMTARVVFAIHVQALKLWLKGARVFRHPRRSESAQSSPQSSGAPIR